MFEKIITGRRDRTGLRMINSARPMLIIHPVVSNIPTAPGGGLPGDQQPGNADGSRGMPMRAWGPAPCAIA